MHTQTRKQVLPRHLIFFFSVVPSSYMIPFKPRSRSILECYEFCLEQRRKRRNFSQRCRPPGARNCARCNHERERLLHARSRRRSSKICKENFFKEVTTHLMMAIINCCSAAACLGKRPRKKAWIFASPKEAADIIMMCPCCCCLTPSRAVCLAF